MSWLARMYDAGPIVHVQLLLVFASFSYHLLGVIRLMASLFDTRHSSSAMAPA